ncbi:MAG: DUF2474 domain-containing protein [Burkholderiales bacterium]
MPNAPHSPLSPPSGDEATQPNWFKRIGWLALIWVASVAALFVVALVIRYVMGLAGLTA